jgi:carbohydrate kinase (thermoresistant glucokinase family)
MLSPVSIVVMGVSGCGKSTVGAHLAKELGVQFIEGDQYHSQVNVQKMANGQPLTDEDRREWLMTLSQMLASAKSLNQTVVMSCSALKEAYRDVLRQGDPLICFVHLNASYELLNQRVHTRSHQYMPASLLSSQLSTLETPKEHENALHISAELMPEQIVQLVLDELQI